MAGRLVILRGNSGSGKSTTARKLREAAGGRIALVEQDYLRRIVLKEKEGQGTDNVDLIEETVAFALVREYDVVLEGIFLSRRYGDMLHRLIERARESHVYYFDIPFDETVRRHQTKANADEFGEREMREWYSDKDLLGVRGERVIDEHSSQDEVVARLLRETAIGASAPATLPRRQSRAARAE